VGARGIGGEGRAGLPNQGGDSHFLQRFALQTHDAYDQVAVMKFAMEHQNPLVTGAVTGGSVFPEASYSLLSISNPNVLLWALKPAEDGIDRGVVARVWNLSNNPASFSLWWSPSSITRAEQTTHIETPLGEATVVNGELVASLAAQQLKTFSMEVPPLNALDKAATPTAGDQGTVITYTLRFTGTGNTLTLTDTLPAGLSAPDNFELMGTGVTPIYDSGQHRLTWSDTPPEGQRVTIRYTTTITTSERKSLVNVVSLTEAGDPPSFARAYVIANPHLTHLPQIFGKSEETVGPKQAYT
jgi:hypothetical protein